MGICITQDLNSEPLVAKHRSVTKVSKTGIRTSTGCPTVWYSTIPCRLTAYRQRGAKEGGGEGKGKKGREIEGKQEREKEREREAGRSNLYHGPKRISKDLTKVSQFFREETKYLTLKTDLKLQKLNLKC